MAKELADNTVIVLICESPAILHSVMVASVFPPPWHLTLFIKVDFLSFLEYLCGTRKEVIFRSAVCSLDSKPASDRSTFAQGGMLLDKAAIGKVDQEEHKSLGIQNSAS